VGQTEFPLQAAFSPNKKMNRTQKDAPVILALDEAFGSNYPMIRERFVVNILTESIKIRRNSPAV